MSVEQLKDPTSDVEYGESNHYILFKAPVIAHKKTNHSLHSKSLNDDVSIAQRNIKNQHPPKKKPNKQTNKGNNAAQI